jgi:arabinofuranan 3-O-arabinosyltransferase
MIADHGMVSEIASAFDHDHELTALVLPERSIGTGFWAECKILEKQLYLGDATVEAARAFRRATFDAVRGFDERIHGGGEDWDLPDRIRAQGGKIGRTKAGVTHDEGHVSLVHDLRKKMYYGRTFGRYAAKHPRRTLGLLVRPSAVGRLPRLFVRPSRAIGLVALKTLELFALCLGMAVAAIAGTHPADGDRVSSHIA